MVHNLETNERPNSSESGAIQARRNLQMEATNEMSRSGAGSNIGRGNIHGKTTEFPRTLIVTDNDTGRKTYQTSKTEGKWVDADGTEGKVNFNSNGARAYFSKDGKKHEYTIRPDGSKWEPGEPGKRGKISGAAKVIKQSDGSEAHIGDNGEHTHTIRKDGSKLDMETRTITKELPGGILETTYLEDNRKVLMNGNSQIVSAGKSEYNEMHFEYDSNNKLKRATKVVEGTHEDVWDKQTANGSTATVSQDGLLSITNRDKSQTIYDRQLVKREYRASDKSLASIEKPNHDKRLIGQDGSILDTYTKGGKHITRTIDANLVLTRSERLHPHPNDPATRPRESSLPRGSNKTIDEKGNLKISTDRVDYHLSLANMQRVKQVRQRNK